MQIRLTTTQMALGLTLAVQVYFVARIGMQAAKPTVRPAVQFVEVGDTVLALTTKTGSMLAKFQNDSGWSILLISVKSTCKWCTEEMPRIRREITNLPKNVRLAVITSEPDSVAKPYLERNGIDAQIIAVDSESQTSLERRITSRTPWAFMLDSHGVVRASSHASDLPRFLAERGKR